MKDAKEVALSILSEGAKAHQQTQDALGSMKHHESMVTHHSAMATHHEDSENYDRAKEHDTAGDHHQSAADHFRRAATHYASGNDTQAEFHMDKAERHGDNAERHERDHDLNTGRVNEATEGPTELSSHLKKTFGTDTWHKKGQKFPRPKPGSKEVSKKDYDTALAQWRADNAHHYK